MFFNIFTFSQKQIQITFDEKNTIHLE